MRNYSKTIGTRPFRIAIFDSPQEAMEHLEAALSQSRIARDFRYYLSQGEKFIGRRLHGFDSVSAAVDGLWPEGVAILDDLLKQLSEVELPRATEVRRRPRWDAENGDDIDYDRMRAGQDFWRTTSRVRLHGTRIVKIVINQTANCDKEAAEILWRGAVGLVLTQLLEDAGYRVELWAAQASVGTYQDGTSRAQAILVKESDQPLDMASLVNLVSGWFFRSACFGMMAIPAEPEADLGRAIEANILLPEIDAEDALTIEDIFSRSAAIAYLNKTLAQFAEA